MLVMQLSMRSCDILGGRRPCRAYVHHTTALSKVWLAIARSEDPLDCLQCFQCNCCSFSLHFAGLLPSSGAPILLVPRSQLGRHHQEQQLLNSQWNRAQSTPPSIVLGGTAHIANISQSAIPMQTVDLGQMVAFKSVPPPRYLCSFGLQAK